MIRVAIDGPSGAGKSTVAKRIAKDLSIIYVDTGAMYRCIGLYALRQGLDTKDSQQVSSCLEQIHLETSYDVQNGQRIFLNGEDVSEAIRTPDASMAASNVSAIPQVRAFLLDLQRDMAKKQSLVMDGRDIGTVVIPDAELKIFLTLLRNPVQDAAIWYMFRKDSSQYTTIFCAMLFCATIRIPPVRQLLCVRLRMLSSWIPQKLTLRIPFRSSRK